MTAVRMGTFSFQRSLAAGLVEAQNRVATAQRQLATGKRHETYAAMGADLRPALSARSVIKSEDAHGAVSARVGQVLARYADGLSALQGQVAALRDAIGQGVANGEIYGLKDELNSAFSALSQTVNLSQGGEFLMAGLSVGTRPFTPTTLSDLAALPTTDDAFVNSDAPLSARVAEGTDMAYGLTARAVGKPVADLLVEIVGLGPIQGKITDVQRTQLTDMFNRLKQLGDELAEQEAANGQRQMQVDGYAERSQARATELEGFVADLEDVDITEVMSRLSNEQAALQASYQAFAAFKSMSLADYLR